MAIKTCGYCGGPFDVPHGSSARKGHRECWLKLSGRSPAQTAAGLANPVLAPVTDPDEPTTDPELRLALRKALLALGKEKRKTEALVESVYSAVYDGVKTLEIRPVPPFKPYKSGSGKEEVAVIGLNDLQLGKATPSYNSAVCERRIEQYAEKINQLTNIQRADHPVKRAHLWALGDIVEGELIFPGQSHLNETSLYMQTCVDGPRIVGNFIRSLLTTFESIHISWIIGNHGRLGGNNNRDYHPESNADRMLGRNVYNILQQDKGIEGRLTWNIPEGLEDSWYAIDDIGGYRTLLIHGDQIDGGLTTENGVKKKVLGWKTGGLGEAFDDVAFGHFHVVKKFSFNTTVVRCFGSPESDNGYAKARLASMSSPSQNLMFVVPGVGVSAEYTVRLD